MVDFNLWYNGLTLTYSSTLKNRLIFEMFPAFNLESLFVWTIGIYVILQWTSLLCSYYTETAWSEIIFAISSEERGTGKSWIFIFIIQTMALFITINQSRVDIQLCHKPEPYLNIRLCHKHRLTNLWLNILFHAYLIYTDLVGDQQSGFRSKHSTLTTFRS